MFNGKGVKQMFGTEDLDLTDPTEGYISSKAVEHMADNLALDEMHNLHFGDIQFVLKDLLREKYKRMTPTELQKLHKERFYYAYADLEDSTWE
jgi:hypothetical protein